MVMTGGADLNTFLVEDHHNTRLILVEAMETLTPVRFVGIATDEPSAKRWLRTHKDLWALAIVDVTLRKGSGLGVLKACQLRSSMQKVVVLTSHVDQKMVDVCRALGADEIFDKNHDIDSLVDYCKVHASYLDFMQQHGLLPPVPAL